MYPDQKKKIKVSILRRIILLRTYFIKQTSTEKKLLFVIFMIIFFAVLIRLKYGMDLKIINHDAIIKGVRYTEVETKTASVSPKDLKYILLWTREDFAPFYFLGQRQRKFLKNSCPVNNCYVTTDKKFFDDLNKFHAIAFNGRNIMDADFHSLSFPRTRSPYQKYIFFNMESSDLDTICNTFFDGFFNWTSTYKLNSDVPYPYILIKNLKGEVIGPKLNMDWIKDLKEVDEAFALKLRNKTKAAAWFVSHCSSKSKREVYVNNLQKELEKYKLKVDVYGNCGPLKCPKNRQAECGTLLKKDYFFYLALENSITDDYVTEKLLTALNNDAVPIVYGGANYSRFLHPNSYLNARAYSPQDLAATMHRLIMSPSLYKEFFRWRTHYTYRDPIDVENVCSLCAALNNKVIFEKHSVYAEFRKWWQPNYVQSCKNG